jgi:HSP20 family protein
MSEIKGESRGVCRGTAFATFGRCISIWFDLAAFFVGSFGMPVFRWGHSWEAFQDFEREVDRLLSSVNFAFQGIRLGRQYPSINLYELPEEYLLTAELPGTKAEEIELALGSGVLKIKGRRSEANGVPEERYRRQERFRGEWERSLAIPDRVREEGLSAEFVDGILRVHLPKGEQAQPRRIRVSEGSE